VPIPRILHRIWVGENPLPEEFVAYGESWERLHPNWEHRLWTEADLPRDLVRQEALETYRIPAERVDVLRYELLWRHGGLYVDTDIEALRPLDPLMDAHDFFTGEMKAGRVNNALIAAAPGHPVMEAAMRDAVFPVYKDPENPPPYTKHGTGPLFFADVVARFPDAKVFPPPVFYPGTDAELEGAYARHYSARSWRTSYPHEMEVAELRAQLDKAEKRHEKAEQRLAKSEAQREAALARLDRSPVQRLRRFVAARAGR